MGKQVKRGSIIWTHVDLGAYSVPGGGEAKEISKGLDLGKTTVKTYSWQLLSPALVLHYFLVLGTPACFFLTGSITFWDDLACSFGCLLNVFLPQW